MNTNNMIPSYIGITDFDNRFRVIEMLDLFPESHPRKLMMGVMSSWKWFHGGTTKWNKVWLPRDQIKQMFVDHPKVFNTLHWADYDNMTSNTDIIRACLDCGKYLHAVQLDMIWPRFNLCWVIRDTIRVPIILQVGKKALEDISNDEAKLLLKLEIYRTLIDGILLDCSMGRGVPMNPELLRSFIIPVKSAFPELHIAVAGGLGPDTIHLVEPIIREFPDVSFDAQGQLRDSGDSTEPINWVRAKNYMAKALELTA